MALSPKTRRAIIAYGADFCRHAYREHHKHGQGARTIAFANSMSTRQADAAIDAGREMEAEALAAAAAAPAGAMRLPVGEASEIDFDSLTPAERDGFFNGAFDATVPADL